MSLPTASLPRAWRFTAVDGAGRRVRDVIEATDEAGAAQALASRGLTPLALESEAAATASGPRRRGLRSSERILVLRQLALLLEAGVALLEALSAVASGVASAEGRAQLEGVAAALTQGEGLAQAFETRAPGFPPYLYAMVRVGERTGRVGEVLREASELMAYEDRLRRDVFNALTYPAFLLCAGSAALLFIFTQVVPRFAALLGERTQTLPWSSRWVLLTGLWANSHLVIVLAGAAALAAGGAAVATNPDARRRAYEAARAAPLVGELLRAREIIGWARLTAFSLQNGVLLMDAAALARDATPAGPFREGLARVEADLRTGAALDAALGRHTRLTTMDLALVRSGARAGALPRMLAFMADGYDARLRDLIKRATALVEPIAIGGIAIVVGAVALSLVLALSSIYENVN